MRPWLVGAAVVVFALLSFFQFPGHTWLQSDTQIYAPILEHLRDPSVLDKDILVQRPHVSFTLYDECALTMRRLTGLGFREVLAIEQWVTRALGIWGFYLMATAAGLSVGPALLATAILSLGGVIVGPSVLIFEYEPVPRGFAVPLLILAVGLTAHGRYLGAGTAGAAAFLIHPPTVYPFWGVYFYLALRRAKPEIMMRRLYEFVPLLIAAIVLLIASRYQAGQGEAQAFFNRLDPLMEKLQRMRASYVWISMWWQSLLGHYLLLYAITLAGWWRLRRETTAELRVFQVGLPLVGMLSMPASYVALEMNKWALMPQFQPLRALLFVTLMAVFTGTVAGCTAARERRFPEAFAWFALAYLVPINARVLAWPGRDRAALIAVLAALACVSVWLAQKSHWGWAAIASTALVAFFAIPGLGRVVNYPKLHTPEVKQLAAWARETTAKDAVFLFPDAARELYPGIFRPEALRAVYVDWKGGGQVNYLKELGEQWWSRWQEAMVKPPDAEQYRRLGIDYLVYRKDNRPAGMMPVYENAVFSVYKIS
jgi:hypothetical protein